MSKPKITVDPRTDEARCAHHDCYGNVCTACFDATPFLMHMYGRTYRMTGAEYVDSIDMLESSRVSAATPHVTVIDSRDIADGDTLLGFTSDARRPLVVEHVENVSARGVSFTDTKSKRRLIGHERVAVVR